MPPLLSLVQGREGRGNEPSDNDNLNPQSILSVYLSRNYQALLAAFMLWSLSHLVNSRKQNPLGAKLVCSVYFSFLAEASVGTHTRLGFTSQKTSTSLSFCSLGATRVFLCLLPSRTCYQTTLFCDLGSGYWTQVLVYLFIRYTLYWLSYLSNLEISF